MPQHDYVLDNQSGASFRADLNNALLAIAGLNSGATAPSTTYAFMLWADTANDLLKIRNAANNAWVTLGTLSATNLGLLSLAGGTLAEAANIALGTSTGTKIGTATAQKLGFWNATPVVQPSSASQAALAAATTVGTNTGTAAAGLSLIGDTSTINQASALMNDFASLRRDIAAAFTLINQLRSDLVAVGIIKGAA
jgi:hypothetical protein